MTNEEIKLKNNLMIAEFMGMEVDGDNWLRISINKPNMVLIDNEELHMGDWYVDSDDGSNTLCLPLSQARFTHDWNWLAYAIGSLNQETVSDYINVDLSSIRNTLSELIHFIETYNYEEAY